MKLQFFDGSFNFFDGIGHLSHVGLTEEQAKEFARKKFGVAPYKIEKKIKEMRETEPILIKNKKDEVLTKLWEITLE